MRCPHCNADNSARVTHSLRASVGRRRRYRCSECRRNFYTRVYEFVEANLSARDIAELDKKARPPARP